MVRRPPNLPWSQNLDVVSGHKAITRSDELSGANSGEEGRVRQLDYGEEALHQSVSLRLLDRKPVQMDIDIGGLDADGREEAEAELVTRVGIGRIKCILGRWLGGLGAVGIEDDVLA